MAEHTVFGAAPPWEPTAHDDGVPIVTAAAFYSTATTWYVVGARLRVPAGASLPAQVTLALRIAAYEALVDLSTAPVASGVADVVEGWTEVRWDPVELAPTAVAWPSLEGGTDYMFASPPGVDPVQASDGADLYLAEATGPQRRAAFRVGSDATTASSAWYGLDLIVSDSPDGPPPSGGSVAAVVVSAAGSGLARHAGGSAASVVVAAAGAGRKRVRRGAAAPVSVLAVGSGYNPANVPDELPVRGSLVPLTLARGAVALTPRRGLEPA